MMQLNGSDIQDYCIAKLCIHCKFRTYPIWWF
uniref:Uncharacterized protein n=1 Tax=Anguilla anguilla TaxID=7936 RepID=A0A0E9UYS6_ANGAN